MIKALPLKLILFLAWNLALPLFAAGEAPVSLTHDDPKLYELVKKTLGGNEDVVRRNIKRLGDRTIELEYFVSADGMIAMAAGILCDFPAYPNWTLQNINTSPDGKPYRFQVTGLGITPEAAGKAVMADLQFKFDLPLFQYAGKRSYRLECARDQTSFVIHAEAAPLKTSIVETSKGFLRVYPAPGQPNKIWLYLRGVIKLSNSVLYELMPEKVVNREASERVYILLSNYLKEEDRVLELKRSQASRK